MKECPILVTGSHRSGTTWVGTMLTYSPPVFYVPEVFNVDRDILQNKGIFKYWFTYINEYNQHEFRDAIADILKIKYGLGTIIGLDKSVRRNNGGGIRGRFQFALKFLNSFTYARRHLLKDPIALFSAEWLAKEFGMDIVILIRHPCAFAYSIQRMNWRFDFNNFLYQRNLMERYLYPFEEQLHQKPDDIIEEAALLWKCIHHVITIYRNKYSNWIFKRLEDISMNPIKEFHDISNRIDIPFTKTMEKKINDYSGPLNLAEASKGITFSLKRDSKSATKIWRERLSEKQISTIRRIVEDVACNFYSDDEW
ncbi:MAG: sulfotransferase [Candidatus Brocadia sp.]|nr:sulfotransferase [Candidatus Brocadia sp.]